MHLKTLHLIIDGIRSSRYGEVTHFDLPRRSGKSKAAAVLSRYKIPILTFSEASKQYLISIGADENFVFTRLEDIYNHSPEAIVIDEGYLRPLLRQDLDELECRTDCPIIVTGTTLRNEI